MKKFVHAATTCAAALLVSNAAYAQSSATVTANGSTTLIRPITITKTADLAFGRIVKPGTGTGTVAVANSADTVIAASGAVALASTTSRAKFTIGGEGGQVISVLVPASFNLSNGTDTIAVTLDPDLGTTTNLSGSMAAGGSAALNVGGNFNVPNAISTGVYSGSFSVTVAYQ
jgi:hypothetical protein